MSNVHASDISQERVDETAKCEHEPAPWEGIREIVELRGSHSEEYEEGFWAGLRAYEDKLKEQDWYGQWQWQCGYERGWDAAWEKASDTIAELERESMMLRARNERLEKEAAEREKNT